MVVQIPPDSTGALPVRSVIGNVEDGCGNLEQGVNSVVRLFSSCFALAASLRFNSWVKGKRRAPWPGEGRPDPLGPASGNLPGGNALPRERGLGAGEGLPLWSPLPSPQPWHSGRPTRRAKLLFQGVGDGKPHLAFPSSVSEGGPKASGGGALAGTGIWQKRAFALCLHQSAGQTRGSSTLTVTI